MNNIRHFFCRLCIGFIKETLTLLRGQQRYSSVFPAQQVLPSGQMVLLSGQDTPETGLSCGRKYRVSQCAMATSSGRRISPLIWRKKFNKSKTIKVRNPSIGLYNTVGSIKEYFRKYTLCHFLPIISRLDSFYCNTSTVKSLKCVLGGGGEKAIFAICKI